METNKPPAIPQLLLTPKQAAEAVHLCEKSLYLASRAGQLKYVLLGRARRYRLADLQTWIDSKVRTGSAP